MTIALQEDPPIPAELKKMPPREVRLRKGGLRGRIHFVVAWVVMGLFSVGMILYSVCEATFLSGAPIVPGHVVDMRTHSGTRGSTTYLVTYEFTDSGKIQTNEESVSRSIYQDLYDGAAVPINTMVIGSHRFTEIHLSTIDYFRQYPVWLVGALFCGIICFAWRQTRARLYECVRNGEPTIGMIESKRTYRTRNGRTYYVKYQYTDSQNCLRTGKRMNVKQTDYEHLQEGDRVVVLFDPMKPSRSLIYRCGPYEAV